MTAMGMSPVSMDPVDGCPGEDQMTLDDVLAQYQTEIYRFAYTLDDREDQFADAYFRAALATDQVP